MFYQGIHPASGTRVAGRVHGLWHVDRRRTRFCEKAKNERYAASAEGGAIGLALTWLLDYFSGKMHQEIVLEAPQCEECHQRGRKMRVQHMDFDRRVITFIVHQNFRRALETLRPS